MGVDVATANGDVHLESVEVKLANSQFLAAGSIDEEGFIRLVASAAPSTGTRWSETRARVRTATTTSSSTARPRSAC